MFQYISCCYLSPLALVLLSSLNCFNTSHVVIYQFSLTTFRSWKKVSIHLMLLFIRTVIFSFCQLLPRFNTSHVVIYQERRTAFVNRLHVSIHLMLLFIEKQKIFADEYLMFQYISCCYLSPSNWSAR